MNGLTLLHLASTASTETIEIEVYIKSKLPGPFNNASHKKNQTLTIYVIRDTLNV